MDAGQTKAVKCPPNDHYDSGSKRWWETCDLKVIAVSSTKLRTESCFSRSKAHHLMYLFPTLSDTWKGRCTGYCLLSAEGCWPAWFASVRYPDSGWAWPMWRPEGRRRVQWRYLFLWLLPSLAVGWLCHHSCQAALSPYLLSLDSKPFCAFLGLHAVVIPGVLHCWFL